MHEGETLMAGYGPAPKDPAKRARVNADPIPSRVVSLVRAGQPDLPSNVAWNPRTLVWWEMWGRAEIARDFTETDWDFLVDTAVLHSAFWGGDMKVAAELRLRAAKFGVTPEDRARLRIVFADADGKDGGSKPKPSARYGQIHAIRPEA